MGGKGKGKGWGKGKQKKDKTMLWRKKKTNPELCVWIGGLDEIKASDDVNKKMKEHFETRGHPAKWAEWRGAVFGTAEEATAAIAAVNGTTFMDKILEVDV